jgi:hypothetical protein
MKAGQPRGDDDRRSHLSRPGESGARGASRSFVQRLQHAIPHSLINYVWEASFSASNTRYLIHSLTMSGRLRLAPPTRDIWGECARAREGRLRDERDAADERDVGRAETRHGHRARTQSSLIWFDRVSPPPCQHTQSQRRHTAPPIPFARLRGCAATLANRRGNIAHRRYSTLTSLSGGGKFFDKSRM